MKGIQNHESRRPHGQDERQAHVDHALCCLITIVALAVITLFHIPLSTVLSVSRVMNMMFTIVKPQQREIAVLCSVGFGREAVAAYVLAQAMLVSVSVTGWRLARHRCSFAACKWKPWA
jgi:hypothetical protein